MSTRISTNTLWIVVADFLPADVSITTLAALDSFSDYGNRYADLTFVFRNSGTHAASFVVDHSEDGTFVEDRASMGAIPEQPCAAGTQATLALSDLKALHFRVSAYSTEAANPATTVNRRILGRLKRF